MCLASICTHAVLLNHVMIVNKCRASVLVLGKTALVALS